MKRSRVRVEGRSTLSQTKRRIQALLRACVILRDSGCILKDHRDTGPCFGPLQAEHLNSRRHARTFGDLRNIVCLCQRHHIFWKPQHSRQYWELIEELIGPARWAWLKLAELDHTPFKADWRLVEIVLQEELNRLHLTHAHSQSS